MRLNAATAASLGLAAGARARVKQGAGEAILAVSLDAALPDGCVRIARGVPETAALGAGALTLEALPEKAVA